jgi:hypothetical protein
MHKETILDLIEKYESQKEYFNEQMRCHPVDSIEGFGNFCNRERCSDFIRDLRILLQKTQSIGK